MTEPKPPVAPHPIAPMLGGLYFSRYTLVVFLLAIVVCTVVSVVWLPPELELWRRVVVGVTGGAFCGITTQAWRMMGSGEVDEG